MQTEKNKYFYCYSYNLAYFIKSCGIRYVNKGRNRNNNLLYYKFLKSKELDEAIIKWNILKNF